MTSLAVIAKDQASNHIEKKVTGTVISNQHHQNGFAYPEKGSTHEVLESGLIKLEQFDQNLQ